MTDFARLGLEIDTTDVDKANESLESLVDSSKAVETQLSTQEKAWVSQGRSLGEMNKKADEYIKGLDQSTTATKKQQTETDKYIASLQRQVDTFGMSRSQLAAYRAAQLQFTDEQALLVAGNLQALASFEKTGGGLEDLGIKSHRAREQIGLLTRDILRGDFSQVGERLGKFVGQSDIAIGTLLRVIAPAAAVVGAIVAIGKAYSDGAEESLKFNNALIITGNYAGQTSDSMLKLARSMAESGDITVGKAKDIVLQLVSSGQISRQAIDGIADLAEKFALGMGKDIGKVGGDLVKIFEDPAKGAEELNKQLNFLDVAQIQYIKSLVAAGHEGDAQVFLLEKLKDRLSGLQQNLGIVETAWTKVKQAASFAWDSMLNIGRPKTLEDQLKDAEAALVASQQRFEAAQTGLIARKRPDVGAAGVTSAQAEVERLRGLVQAQKDAALAASEAAEANRDERLSHEEVKGLLEEQLNRQLRIAEVTNKSTNAEIEGQFKIHAISEEERNNQLLASDLQLASIRLQVNERKRGADDLTAVEMARLQTEVVIIDAQRKARITEFERAQRLLDITRQQAQAQADAQSAAQTAGTQLGEIGDMQKANEQLRQRQRELGLTAEQVDVLRQAELDLAIAMKETELSRTLEEGTPEDSPFIQRLKAEIELMKQRQTLELATDTTSLKQAQYDNQLQLLRDAREAGVITASEFDDEERELAVQHEAAMSGIHNKGYMDRLRFAKMSTVQQTEFVLGQLESMLAGAAQHNKLAFEAHKVVSIGNAIVSTYTGATKALEWGWPLGPIFAAAITLAGLANVAYISGTQFGGGAAGGVGAAVGSGVSVDPTANTPIVGQPTQPVQPATHIIQIFGTQSEKEFARRIFEQMNEQGIDGMKFAVETSP